MHTQYASIITNCILTKQLKLGRLLHARLVKTSLNLDIFLANRLIHFYSICDSLTCAQQVFDELHFKNPFSWNAIISAYSRIGHFYIARHLIDEMPEPNIVSYNSLISGLSRYGFYNESLSVFKRIQDEQNHILMDEFTLVSVVGACACLGALELLYQLHGVAVVNGLRFNVVVYNALIDAYGKCRRPDISYLIFSQMQERDIVSWTSMVVAYAQASRLMDARRVFNQMPVKNTVTWTSLIAGYAQNGQGNESLVLFKQMLEERIPVSGFTYVSALSACADMAHFLIGKQIHCSIVRTNTMSYKHNVYISNALLDMYCKCGDMKSANTLFKKIDLKDVITWNSIITGYARNGRGQESLALFNEMIGTPNIKPNHVTFLAVLSGCSHTGLVSEGLRILEMMEKEFGVIPKLDHYAVLIDLLGRKNRLEEALELVVRAPTASDHVGMWGALLNACRVHENLDIARIAAEELFKLEPDNSGRYVMLSNVYAAAGKWDAARRVRNLMDERELSKEAAYSWIETQNIGEFVSESDSGVNYSTSP